MKKLNRLIGLAFNFIGYKISVKDIETMQDNFLEKDFVKFYEECKPYTMISKERAYAVYQSVKYVIDANIPGDFVECGVWKGGCVMLIIKTLQSLGVTDRNIILYDTFDGMTPPTNKDVDFRGRKAKDELKLFKKNGTHNLWADADIGEVSANIRKLNYPPENLFFIVGDVEKTLPGCSPNEIALLRLDTDWYESTKHELVHLYPVLSKGGVLLIDDYGFWKGAKKAVNEYFKDKKGILLCRTDFTGRLLIKR